MLPFSRRRAGRGHSGTTMRMMTRVAAFWMVAAADAAMPGFMVTLENVGRTPTRTSLIGVLRKFGAHVDLHETANAAGEPIGTIIVTGHRTGSIHIQLHEFPELIEELPAIAALVAGLRALGVQPEKRPDGFTSHGPGTLSGGVADAAGDRRLPVTFAGTALAAGAPSRREDANGVSISYPTFFETVARLVA